MRRTWRRCRFAAAPTNPATCAMSPNLSRRCAVSRWTALRGRRPRISSTFSRWPVPMHDVHEPRSSFCLMRRRLLQALPAAGLALCLPGLAFGGAYDQWFKAIKLDLEDQVRTLLQRGIDPNTIDEERGDTALILAA